MKSKNKKKEIYVYVYVTHTITKDVRDLYQLQSRNGSPCRISLKHENWI